MRIGGEHKILGRRGGGQRSAAKQEREDFHRWSCEKDPDGLKSQLVSWWLSSVSPERR